MQPLASEPTNKDCGAKMSVLLRLGRGDDWQGTCHRVGCLRSTRHACRRKQAPEHAPPARTLALLSPHPAATTPRFTTTTLSLCRPCKPSLLDGARLTDTAARCCAVVPNHPIHPVPIDDGRSMAAHQQVRQTHPFHRTRTSTAARDAFLGGGCRLLTAPGKPTPSLSASLLALRSN